MKPVVFNPLPEALAHYVVELEAVFGGVTLVDSPSEGLTPLGRLTGLIRHVVAARRTAMSGAVVVVAWPLLGWLELLLWHSRCSKVFVVVHDPKPLRRQVGLGQFGARAARRLRRSNTAPTIIAHSSIAAADIANLVPGYDVVQLPHPVMLRQQADVARKAREFGVFGQFKEARDLDLLSRLGRRLETLGYVGTISGRGWPAIEGWSVDSRFLTEAELDRRMLRSTAIILPYRHYYQSGIAVRAIELGVPIVANEHPFVTELLGPDYIGTVRDDSLEGWIAAIENVIEGGDTPPMDAVAMRVTSAWRAVFSDVV